MLSILRTLLAALLIASLGACAKRHAAHDTTSTTNPATTPPAATGSAAPASASESAQNGFLTYCAPDIQRLCPGVSAGGGRIKNCLMGKKEQMSVGCAQALQKMKQEQK